MIDQEKLKQLIEICESSKGKSPYWVRILIGFDSNILYEIMGEYGELFISYESIDEVIIKLQSLIDPPPKNKANGNIYGEIN